MDFILALPHIKLVLLDNPQPPTQTHFKLLDAEKMIQTTILFTMSNIFILKSEPVTKSPNV